MTAITGKPAASVGGGSANMTSKDEFLKRLSLLKGDGIGAKINAGDYRLADVAFYRTASISQVTEKKVLNTDDTKAFGIGNLQFRQLQKDQVFLLHAVRLMYGVNSSTTDPGNVDFDLIPAVVANGEFELKANGGEIIPLSSCAIFDTELQQVPKGYYKLDNPVLIQTQKDIEFNMFWKTAAVQYAWLKLMLIGTITNKR
ncbi:MAG: hypothetical protein WC707_06995 [Candidatus Babeliaceae bacterium]